jgi:hypothetical protein
MLCNMLWQIAAGDTFIPEFDSNQGFHPASGGQ